jgi:hypothetical protein
MHAQTAEELVVLIKDGGEFVVRGYVLGGDPVVVRQLVLLSTAGFALLATDTKGRVVKECLTHTLSDELIRPVERRVGWSSAARKGRMRCDLG